MALRFHSITALMSQIHPTLTIIIFKTSVKPL